MRRHRLSWLLFLALCLVACRPDAPAVDLDAAFDGLRFVQPRWVGLDYSPCTLSDDFFPVATCDDGPRSEARQREALDALASTLPWAFDGSVSVEDLRRGARWEALTASDSAALRRASVFLLEAAERSHGKQRADVDSDLAALHLMLAERLQSAAALVDALDAASRALQLDPDHGAARFNRNLALLWLGVMTEMPESQDDPWVKEQHRHWNVEPSAEDGDDSGAETCWSRAALRSALGTWSAEATEPAEVPPWAVTQRRCWQDADDRLFADVLDDLTADPAAFRRQWRQVDAAKQALASFDLDAAEPILQTLRRATSEPLRLAGLGFETQAAYFRAQPDVAARLALRQLEVSRSASYLEMAGRTLMQQALAALTQGNYGLASELLDEALEVARRARSEALLAGIRSLRVEVWQVTGRDDDAWFEVAKALRALGTTYPGRRLGILQFAANMAGKQGLVRAQTELLDVALAEAQQLGPIEAATLHLARGEVLAEQGDVDGARRDLVQGRRLATEALEDPNIGATVAQTVLDDLGLLAGLVGETPSARLDALASTVAAYRKDEYGQKLITAQRRLAAARQGLGDTAGATTEALAAFEELKFQAASWNDRAAGAAILAASRPLVGDVLKLQLAAGEAEDALATLAEFLGLRSGRRQSAPDPARTGQRLSYFVRDDGILIFWQGDGDLQTRQVAVPRQRLLDLKRLFLGQLQTGADLDRLHVIAEQLAELLIEPMIGLMTSSPEELLHIVADDVLAGLPFHLLPLHGETPDERLIDRWAVSYGTDLHVPEPRAAPRHLLSVGLTAPPLGLSPLPAAEDEARAVADLYVESGAQADTLVGTDATVEGVLDGLAGRDGLHVASHFRLHDKRPEQSALLLPGESPEGLTVAALLQALGDAPLSLLYLSACDTGAGLAPSSHGVHSLAQVLVGPPVEVAVLSLWPLDDATGQGLAEAFHRHVLEGASPAAALRQAQLSYRDQRLSSWGALVVYQ